MNNNSRRGVPSEISAPRTNNHQGIEQPNLTITTETENQHNPVKCTYHTTDPGFESVFLMDEIDDSREPPPKLTAAPPLSPAVVKPTRLSKEPVKQKRGRFLVWPAHLDQPLDFNSS